MSPEASQRNGGFRWVLSNLNSCGCSQDNILGSLLARLYGLFLMLLDFLVAIYGAQEVVPSHRVHIAGARVISVPKGELVRRKEICCNQI